MGRISNMLPDGEATAYIAIFNAHGKPIIDPVSGYTLGMLCTDFSYKYSKKKDEGDSADISVESQNPNLIDLPDLRTKAHLILQWGWKYPNGKIVSSPHRVVQIVDYELTMSETNTKLIITCSDIPHASHIHHPGSGELFSDWVKNGLSGKIGVSILDYSDPITQIQYKKK